MTSHTKNTLPSGAGFANEFLRIYCATVKGMENGGEPQYTVNIASDVSDFDTNYMSESPVGSPHITRAIAKEFDSHSWLLEEFGVFPHHQARVSRRTLMCEIATRATIADLALQGSDLAERLRSLIIAAGERLAKTTNNPSDQPLYHGTNAFAVECLVPKGNNDLSMIHALRYVLLKMNNAGVNAALTI